ncbi:MAG: nitrile hydratase subunit alpha [Pseudomonadota bacterium]|nr:nitrile hydratase subunit alpha [Pseudomonadota bacterium]
MSTDDRDAHDHPGTTPDVNETGYYELMAEAIKEVLIEKGVVSAEDVRRNLEFLDSRDPVDGGRVVARAWTDPEFKKRLLENGTSAVEEMGLTMGDAELIVVENTDDVHNMVVCTLCSCYPRTLLGLPPDWYKSKSYRSRAVIEPRAVLKEFGTHIPDNRTVRVHDSNADMRYLVLPQRPVGTDSWSVDQLVDIVSRDAMVGVSIPTS